MTLFRVMAGRVDANTVAELKVGADGTLPVEVTNFSSGLDAQLSDALLAGKAYVSSVVQNVAKSGFMALQATIPDDNTTRFVIDWSVAVTFGADIQIIEGGTIANATALTFENRDRGSVNATAASVGYELSAVNPVTGGNTIYNAVLPFEKQIGPNDAGQFIAANNTTYVFLIAQSKLGDSRDSFKINLTELTA